MFFIYYFLYLLGVYFLFFSFARAIPISIASRILWIASSEAGSPLNSKVSVFINYYSKIELGLRNPSYNFMEKFKANFGHACIDEIFLEEITHNV